MALEERDTQTVPLAREVAFANAYLSIERVRFHDRLAVEMDVDEDLQAVEVPHLILQPLVENAVRHGIAPLSRPGTLRVAATREGQRLRLLVEDDGVGLRNGKRPPSTFTADAPDTRLDDKALDDEGLGLAVTRDRLRAAYDDFRFEVTERANGGVRVLIELPIHSSFAPRLAPPATVGERTGGERCAHR